MCIPCNKVQLSVVRLIDFCIQKKSIPSIYCIQGVIGSHPIVNEQSLFSKPYILVPSRKIFKL